MDTVISLLVISTLVQHVVPEVELDANFRAVAERVSGDSRIFSGENIRLRCSIPDVHRFTWNYQWFRGSEQLAQSGDQLVLWKARVKDSGKFYCRGVRDSLTILQCFDLATHLAVFFFPPRDLCSGGWAILQVPPHPGLVGETLKVTCRVRDNPPLNEVALYKGDVEIIRQNGLNQHFYLTNLNLEDQGMYSCRASWDADRRTHSVISVEASVKVLEVLTQPVLEIVADDNLVPAEMIKLICHLQYSAPAPAPPIHYYFYKNNNRLGTATSVNHDLVRRTPGQYSCRAKVPQLQVSRWSETKSFGQETGRPTPPIPHPRHQWSFAPLVASPDLSLPLAAGPTATRLPPYQSTEALTFTHPTELSTQSSDPPLKLSQPAPSSLLSPTQSTNQAAAATRDEPTVTSSHQPDDGSGESGDLAEDSGDMSGRSPYSVIY
ncbi:putative high affinity immunoglobulin epsilon receptor subunit alpha [Scophthalmus maximus]|nr:putative high affinity immunoglobulin epsilon receptor subunit alpha [Scophthalmus maximus]